MEGQSLVLHVLAALLLYLVTGVQTGEACNHLYYCIW